jgi:ribokinase
MVSGSRIRFLVGDLSFRRTGSRALLPSQHLTVLCERESVPLVLDPAPAQHLSSGVLSKVTWITPNDTEARQLTGLEGSTDSEQKLRLLAERLLEMGPRNVLLKLGGRGAYVATEDGIRAAIPTYSVDAVDTSAADDAFNGAFAVALARGAAPLDAAQFATAAAAISVTRHGALPSMPTQAEVESFLAAQQELAL